MSEKASHHSPEFEEIVEYSVSNHDKGEHAIYKRVPDILVSILNDLPSFEGFAIGGSYANGHYREGEDIDLDVFFDKYLEPFMQQILLRELERRFSTNGLVAEVRAPLAKSSLPASMRKGLYESHPHTPFVVRNEQVAKDWGLVAES